MVPKVVGSNPIFHPSKRSNKVSATTPFVFLTTLYACIHKVCKDDKRCCVATYCVVQFGGAPAASSRERR